MNEEGKAQAQRMAECFVGVVVEAIYSSPLERALETAEPIARVKGLEVKQSEAFNEIDFGEWSGKSFDELAGDERWRRFNTQRSLARIPSGTSGGDPVGTPGGESFLDVQARVVAELNRLSEQHRHANVVIVSHADVIKAAVGYIAGTPIDLLQRFEISPGSVSIIDTGQQGTNPQGTNPQNTQPHGTQLQGTQPPETNPQDTKLLAVNSRCELV